MSGPSDLADGVYLDAALGEDRWTRFVGGRPDRFVVVRESEQTRRAWLGEVYVGRVRALVAGGAFVGLGRGEDGFLPFRSGRPPAGLAAGAPILAAVRAEAVRGKGPVLKALATPEGSAELGDAPRLVRGCAPSREAPPFDPGVEAAASTVITGGAAREAADLATLAVGSRHVPLPGGGRLCVEPTQALLAIDVDAGARVGGNPPGRVAFGVNLAAAEEAARHIGLRGWGGLVAIDFVRLDPPKRREELIARLRAALKAVGVRADVAPLSRFGVAEIAVSRARRPVHEALYDDEGRALVETVALDGLRALERAGEAARGAQVTLRVAAEVAEWLDAGHIEWRARLTDRLGARFDVEAVPAAGRAWIDVRTR